MIVIVRPAIGYFSFQEGLVKKATILITLAISTLTIFVLVPTSLTAGGDVHEHTTTSQNRLDESRAYKQWYDAYQGRDYTRAVELAKQYLESYPNGKYSAYLRTWTEAAEKQILKAQSLSDHRMEAVAIAASGGQIEVLMSLM